jgi:hypothetical protein
MKIEAEDSFFESIERLAWYDTKLWKVLDFIKRTIPRFFKNIWRFRKELASHEWWDYHFTLEMLYRSLSIMEAKMVDGMEEPISRNKKVAKMRRALELLKHKLDDDYIERAESELGKIDSNPFEFEKTEKGNYRLIDNDTPAQRRHATKVYKRARVMEEKEWKELWDIFKGKKFTNWEDYDGSDLRGWWD